MSELGVRTRKATFIGGGAISEFGNGLYLVVITWTIARLPHAPMLLALVGILAILPDIVLSVPLGVVVDRVPRGKILVLADLLRFLLLLAFAFVRPGLGFEIGVLVLTVLMNVSRVPYMAASRSVLPDLFTEDTLLNINSLRATGQKVGSATGMVAGGILAFLGFELTSFVDALTFLVSALCWLALSIWRMQTHASGKKSYWHQLYESKQIVAKYKTVFLLAFSATIVNFGFVAVTVFGVWFIKTQFHRTSLGYSLFELAFVIGEIAGALFVRKLRNMTVRTGVTAGFFMAGACLIAMSVTPFYDAALALAVIAAVGVMLCNIPFMSYTQSIVQSEERGRVFSIISFLNTIFTPLGQLIFGFLLLSMKAGDIVFIGGLFALAATAMAYFVSSDIKGVRA